MEKTSESPLDSREIKSVNPKVNQLWLFIGRIETKAPILLPPDVKSQLTRKDLDAKKEWGQEKEEATEDDGWMESSPERAWVWANSGDNEGQGSLACLQSMGHKESDTTEWLNKNNCILTAMRWHLTAVLICISPIIGDVGYFFIYLLAIFMSSLVKCLFRFSAHFSIDFFFNIKLHKLFVYFRD